MGVQAFNLTQSNENYIINNAMKGKRSQLVNRMIEYYRYTDIEKFEEFQNMRASRDKLQAIVLELTAEKPQNDPQRGGIYTRFSAGLDVLSHSFDLLEHRLSR